VNARRGWIAGAAAAAMAAAAAWLLTSQLPQPGSTAYEEVTRAFYRGLASLQVGLLDGAREEFTRATELVPREPAAWANLGLAYLRLGDLDASAAPIDRAVRLAPGNSALALLEGRTAIARGRVDEGLAALRRAVTLDPQSVRARFALAEEIERAGGANADLEAQDALDALLAVDPGNLAVIVERTRLAAKRGDLERLRDAIARLSAPAAAWPQAATDQFGALRQAVAASNTAEAARAIAFLRNVLARVPAFQDSLAAARTPAELIAEPFDRFLALAPASPAPAPRDEGLAYTSEPLEGAALPAPGRLDLDWNNDFQMEALDVAQEGASHAWAADIEMDGDIDAVLGIPDRSPVVLRNNGNGTRDRIDLFSGVTGARAFAWADADRDGDPDAALLDGAGILHVFANRQAGDFQRVPPPQVSGNLVALVPGDANADGVLDLITLNAAGEIARSSSSDAGWTTDMLAMWPGMPADAVARPYRLWLADLDNNGGLDLVASGGGRTGLWLAGGDGAFAAITAPDVDVLAVADVTGDGLLDLLGTAGGSPVRLRASGRMNYHWQAISPRAQPFTGDQRINSFGIGGEIEVRSGLLTQKQILTGAPAHFGLGTRDAIDVARIVWPNGVMQAEFDPAVDGTIVATQRLKGSCPWVFAYDGQRMQFVTDFLWRSPLGLRINAQDTAGVAQTEDWVRIGGGQLAPRDGMYDVRITAELWETHFIDHVALLVVDHPPGTDVFVDERFAREPPTMQAHAVSTPRAVVRAWDDTGREVTAMVAAQDGRYLATFERGAYQGIAKEHFVEVELAEPIDADGARWLVAHGWVYPTDSSINVAIGQGGHVQPRGLSLEAQDRSGRWAVVAPDLGFPAGKNKTILIDLQQVTRAGVSQVRRLRLRTNLEIYWDYLATADDLRATHASPLLTRRLQPGVAELRFRGFSETDYGRRDVPETPHYDRLASTSPRWRDLTGYHTRFGDVQPLVAGVDDRYVIMNAGDELRLRFPAPPPPPAGWTRDFVLIGDGWEKDGDFNTGASQTVLPLPSHDRPDYPIAVTELEDDPVYRRHAEDWQHYHTRYVTPRAYLDGLRVR
jgi:tetratricopeptide (TPR) repeat protein